MIKGEQIIIIISFPNSRIYMFESQYPGQALCKGYFQCLEHDTLWNILIKFKGVWFSFNIFKFHVIMEQHNNVSNSHQQSDRYMFKLGFNS